MNKTQHITSWESREERVLDLDSLHGETVFAGEVRNRAAIFAQI